MKIIVYTALFALHSLAAADCASSLPLTGTASIPYCDARTQRCLPAEDAILNYISAMDDDPSTLYLSLHTSPWHFYDADWRILGTEELADILRPKLSAEVRKIILLASWSGVAAEPGAQSLAVKLSRALKGFPVQGQDGFIWLDKNGISRTTRQAFTLSQGGGPYQVAEGGEVMVALAGGWPATFEAELMQHKHAQGIRRAGAGWEMLFLCPEHALKAFKAASQLGDAIAAYNAAMLYLERGSKDDRQTALRLLRQAAAAGDQHARRKLSTLLTK